MRPARLVRLLRTQRAKLDPLLPHDRPDDRFEQVWRRTVKRRALVVLSIIGLWVIGIEARLVYLQVFQHEVLSAKARRHQEKRTTLEALRGDIVDRHGLLLAYSVDAESVGVDPSMVEEPEKTATALCAALGDCAAKSRKELLARLSADGQWQIIRRSRDISPDQVARIKALKLPGIVAQSDTRRYYPRYELASHVVGFVGSDNNGQAGVELAYNKLIHGKDGLAYVQVDAKRQRLESRIEHAPEPGARLELTIDLNLQHIAERELKAGVEANRAVGGTAVIMDPATGEILALASYPTFNPNAVGRFSDDDRRNRASQDVYEPGSTFKIVTASAAIEEGVVRLGELIDTNPGYITIPGRAKPINDDHRSGVLTFEDVIVKSSNVGAVKVGLRTGSERLTRYVHRFGFGEALARDFNGQSRGLWNPAALNESGLASVSMGYQVGVTPLQMATAVSAVANGGLLMQPHVVRAVVRANRRDVVQPKVLRRAISAETAATLTGIMEGVVSSRGTASRASLDGYQVAGKTGTASKIVDGAYSKSDYNASFVGFVPSRQPAFTILVVIDSPHAQGYYGGLVAAPIFKRIAEAALLQSGIPPTNPIPPMLVTPEPPLLPVRVAPSVVPALTPVGGARLMPDLTGLSAREALRVLIDVGLTPRVVGAGFVTRQMPAAGEPVDAGGWGQIELRRTMVDAGQSRGPQ